MPNILGMVKISYGSFTIIQVFISLSKAINKKIKNFFSKAELKIHNIMYLMYFWQLNLGY